MSQTETGVLVIGVDVGGTKVAAGFVNHIGEILQHARAPMNPNGTAAEGFAAVTSAIDELLKSQPESKNAALRWHGCPAIQPTALELKTEEWPSG